MLFLCVYIHFGISLTKNLQNKKSKSTQSKHKEKKEHSKEFPSHNNHKVKRVKEEKSSKKRKITICIVLLLSMHTKDEHIYRIENLPIWE